MPPVLPAYRLVHFPPVSSEMESTSTSPQFRSGTGSSTIVYIHTPEDESDAQKHLSGGRITSAMCRRAVKKTLSSTLKTPAGIPEFFLKLSGHSELWPPSFYYKFGF
jgi:hypothetical protein